MDSHDFVRRLHVVRIRSHHLQQVSKRQVSFRDLALEARSGDFGVSRAAADVRDVCQVSAADAVHYARELQVHARAVRNGRVRFSVHDDGNRHVQQLDVEKGYAARPTVLVVHSNCDGHHRHHPVSAEL